MKKVLFVTRKEDHLVADKLFLKISGHYDSANKPTPLESFSATYVFSEQEAKEALAMEKFDASIFLGLNLPRNTLGRNYSEPEPKWGLETLTLVRTAGIPGNRISTYVISNSLESIPSNLQPQVVHTNNSALPEYLRTSISKGKSGILVLRGFNPEKA